MNKAVPIVVAVVVVAGILAIYSLVPTIFPKPSHSTTTTTTSTSTFPDSEQTYHEGQLTVTTGVLWAQNANPSIYQLETSLRSVTQSLVVSINGTVMVPGMSQPVELKFLQGLTPISSTVPLGYNRTANAEADLPPPTTGSYQPGQSFPETLDITFQNGTSTVLHVQTLVFIFSCCP